MNASIKERQFEHYVESLLNAPFFFAPGICQEMLIQTLRCQALSKNNRELRRVFIEVEPRMVATQSLCESGLTSLGKYRVESCHLSALAGNPSSPNIHDHEISCMRQFQCYMMPNEKRMNPWNVTIPEKAWVPLTTGEVPKSATLVGRQAILTEIIAEELDRRADIKSVIKTLASGAMYSLAIALLFVVSPAGFFFSSTTYGLFPWASALLGGHIASNLAYSSHRISDIRELEDAVDNLNVIAN